MLGFGVAWTATPIADAANADVAPLINCGGCRLSRGMDDCSILTFVTPHYATWLKHLARNLQHFFPGHASCVVCHADSDNATANLARTLRLPTYPVPFDHCDSRSASLVDVHYRPSRFAVERWKLSPPDPTLAVTSDSYAGGALHNAHTQRKTLCVLSVLSHVATAASNSWLLFLDADVSLLRSPLPPESWAGSSLASRLFVGVDAAFQDDTRYPSKHRGAPQRELQLNSGLFFVRRSERARKFWSQLLGRHCADPHSNDQVHLNDALRLHANVVLQPPYPPEDPPKGAAQDDVPNSSRLRVAVLPLDCFQSGWRFYRRSPEERLRSVVANHSLPCQGGWLVAVHHNHIRGREADKLRRAQLFGMVTREGEGYSSFIARARRQMASLPAWAPSYCHRLHSKVECATMLVGRDERSAVQRHEAAWRHRRMHYGMAVLLLLFVLVMTGAVCFIAIIGGFCGDSAQGQGDDESV